MSTPAEVVTTQEEGFKDRTLHRLTLFVQRHWKTLVLAIPFAWLLLFFLAPFFFVLKISVAETTIASPPYTPLIEWVDEGIMHVRVVIDNYAYLWEDDLYVNTYLNSLKISVISTILCLLLGYPIAYAIVRSSHTTKHILLMLIILPFWTSFLLRVYAWMGILADQGLINDFIKWMGFEPLRLFYAAGVWAVGPWLGVYLKDQVGDWVPFALASAAALAALALFWILRLKENPAVAPAKGPPPNPLKNLAHFFEQPRLRLAWLLAVGRSAWWMMFFIYAPIYAVESGLDQVTAGAIVSIASGALFIVPLWGWLARPSPEQVERFVRETRLLTHREMRALFPDCEIRRERFLGLTKSYVAVR